MKFFGITSALLIGTATALPSLFQRDVSSQNASIATVESDYASLNQTVAAFQPTALTTLSSLEQIQTQSQTLQNDLNKAINLMSGGQLSIMDSITLLLERLAFEPVLISYLLLMIASKPKFDSIAEVISVRKTILAILQEQASLTQEMDTAIEGVMNPFIAYGMKAVALAESVLFDATELVYEVPAPAGHIELPAGQLPDPSQLPSA